MNRRYVLIGVEGNHDQAFVGKILQKILGFSKFDGSESDLEKTSFWRKFIPTYPKKNLYHRLDMPSVFNRDDLSVAIYVGEGSTLIQNLEAKLSDIVDLNRKLIAFGIIADSDKRLPSVSVQIFNEGLKNLFPEFPNKVGINGGFSVKSQPRLGLYILPNNQDQGTLENILCKCGDIVYPEYMKRARDYINQFSKEETTQFKWKPFDQEKATLATVVSVLKPGKTNTVSITDNNWVSNGLEDQVPELGNLVNFLQLLLFGDEASAELD